MLIIGCDYHPGFQQIAFVDTSSDFAVPTQSAPSKTSASDREFLVVVSL